MQNKNFKLSRKASELFNKTVAAIREGIINVSEMRLRDSKPHSLSKTDFEQAYIKKTLGAVVGAVSADIRGMTDVLSKQAEAEADELARKLGYMDEGGGADIAGIHNGKPITPPKKAGQENIKEDN